MKGWMNAAENCKYYSECNASMCPMDEVSLVDSIWYPSEDICKVKKFTTLLWIRNQRKIQKKVINYQGYFTLGMLSRKFRITKFLKGLDSDKNREDKRELQKWIRVHNLLRQRRVSEISLEALKKATYNRSQSKKGRL